MAPAFDRGFWLATIIVYSIFMLGAAVGHVCSMLAEHNFAPGNAGLHLLVRHPGAGLPHRDVRRHPLTTTATGASRSRLNIGKPRSRLVRKAQGVDRGHFGHGTLRP